MHSATSVDEHRRGERQRRELRRAEVADDRGVDEQVQRLGGERAEGGQREAQDLAVVGGAAHPRPLYDPPHGPGPRAARRRVAGGLRRERATPLDERVHEPPARHRARAAPARRGPVTLPVGHAAVAVRAPTRAATPTCRPRAPSSRARPTTSPPRPRRGDADAALRLGYLVGAARRGAQRTAGIHAELQRHIERSAAVLDGAGARIAARAGARAARRGGDRMKLRLYHHPDGARVAYREAGTGPRPRAPALGAAQPPRVRAGRRAPRRPLPRRPPRPAAARRLRGPPAPPLHARLAGRGHRRLLRRDRRAAPARRRPRPRRARSCCARVELRRARARRGSCSCPTALHRPPSAPRDDAGATAARAGRACPGLDRVLTHGARARLPARARRASSRRAPTRPRATSCATPSPTSAATPTSRARGRASPSAGRRGPRRELLDLYPRLDFPVLLLWADEDRRHPLQAAEEALDLLPDAPAARAAAAPASSWPTTTRSASRGSWRRSAARVRP